MGKTQYLCLEIIKSLIEKQILKGFEEIKICKIDHYEIKILKQSNKKTYILYICNDDNLYMELTKNKLYGIFKDNKISFNGGECDKYFYDIATSIEENINKYLVELDIEELLCIGYSFGGTVASIITTKLNMSHLKQTITKGIKGYIFGNSPVFSGNSLLKETKKYIKSIILNTDPTPKINAGLFNLPGNIVILNEFGEIPTTNNQNNNLLDYGKLYNFGFQKYFTAIKIYYINKYDIPLDMMINLIKLQKSKLNKSNSDENETEDSTIIENKIMTDQNESTSEIQSEKDFCINNEPETKQCKIEFSFVYEQEPNQSAQKQRVNSKPHDNNFEQSLIFDQMQSNERKFNFEKNVMQININDMPKNSFSIIKSNTHEFITDQKPNINLKAKSKTQNVENKPQASNVNNKIVGNDVMRRNSINKIRKLRKVAPKKKTFCNFDFKG